MILSRATVFISLLFLSACINIRTKQRQDETVTPRVVEAPISATEIRPVSTLPPEFRPDLRFQNAEALEQSGDWAAALKEYRDIANTFRSVNERASTYALFRMSFCYESQGDDVKAVSSLIDAYNRKNFLPEEIAYAEIPARLGFIYARLGYEDLANKNFDAASKGLVYLRAKNKGVDQEWIASTLIQMGTLNLSQISEENFKNLSRTFMRSQNFLAEAIGVNNDNASKKAALVLQNHYMLMWNFMAGLQAKPGVDSVIAKSDLYSRQNVMADLILENILALEARWFVYNDDEEKQKYWEIEKFAKMLEKETNSFLAERAERTPLTFEAQNLQSLRKDFKVLDVSPTPRLQIPELSPEPPPDLPKDMIKDPNL